MQALASMRGGKGGSVLVEGCPHLGEPCAGLDSGVGGLIVGGWWINRWGFIPWLSSLFCS